jgi:hypothetical protein
MKLHVCYKGEHKFKPSDFNVKLKRKRLSGKFMFTKSCLYPQLYYEGNPYDGQNKVIGVQLDLYRKHYNSALIAWRHNQDEEIIEVGAYWHRKGSVEWFREPLLRVKPNEVIEYKIVIGKNQVAIYLRKEGTSEWVSKRKELKTSCISYVLPPWFGGRVPAPQDTYLHLSY